MSAHFYPALINPSTLPPTAGDCRRLRIVVVDDSPTFLKVICALLELEEEVDVIARVADGSEAIEVVADLQPDLVLMDVHMPYLDGLTATMLITERSPLITVVLMSSEDMPELRVDCRSFGAEQFICKSDVRKEFPAVLENAKQALRARR